MVQDRPFVWKSHWKQLGWAWKLGWVGPQGILRETLAVVCGEQCEPGWWSLRYGTCLLALWGRAQKRKNGLCQHFSLRESCSCRHSPWCWAVKFLPACLWCLSSCCPSAGAQTKWVQVSPCVVPFKEVPGPPSLSASTPTGFYSQKLWGFLFVYWNPGLGGLVWGWKPSLLRGDLCSWDIPPNFHLHR